MTMSRRAEIEAELRARTGIDEAMIETLVRRFYDRVRKDDLLAPIFESKIKEWEPHLHRMFDFWSSVALMTGRYHGMPMPKHMRLPVDAEHFDRWLALFEKTAEETCPPAAAEHFISRARNIAESLELGVAIHNGTMLKRGERFYREAAE